MMQYPCFPTTYNSSRSEVYDFVVKRAEPDHVFALVSLFIYFSRVGVRHNDVTAQAGAIYVVLHQVLPQAFFLPSKWPTERVRSFGNSIQPGRIPIEFDRKYSTTGRTATGYSPGKKNDCRGKCNSRSKHSIDQHGDDRQQQTLLTNFTAKRTCHLSA